MCAVFCFSSPPPLFAPPLYVCVEMSVVLSCCVLRYHYITGRVGSGEGWGANRAHVRCQRGNQVDHGWRIQWRVLTAVASGQHGNGRTSFKMCFEYVSRVVMICLKFK